MYVLYKELTIKHLWTLIYEEREGERNRKETNTTVLKNKSKHSKPWSTPWKTERRMRCFIVFLLCMCGMCFNGWCSAVCWNLFSHFCIIKLKHKSEMKTKLIHNQHNWITVNLHNSKLSTQQPLAYWMKKLVFIFPINLMAALPLIYLSYCASSTHLFPLEFVTFNYCVDISLLQKDQLVSIV